MVKGLILHPVEDAISLALRRGPRPSVEHVGLDRAAGRIASVNVRAPSDVPPRDRSVLDGFAVRWTDISGATTEAPVILRLAGYVPVDAEDPGVLHSREAVRVDTGSPLPRGADVVVPQEYAEVRGGSVAVLRAFPAGYGVAVKGEDLRKGDTIVEVGDVITDAKLGLLASIGVSIVSVYKPLRAVVYPVGDEIVEPWEERRPGTVYDSTSRLVFAWLRSRGLIVERRARIGDDEASVSRALEEAIESDFEVIVFTGGTSVGKRDVTARVIAREADDYVHGLALTPGRPGLVAVSRGKLILGLSGMPVAAWSQLVAVFDEYLRRTIGRKRPWEPVVEAGIARRYTSAPGMVNVVRARLFSKGGRVLVEPLRVTGSGILSTLIRANAYFIVPEEVSGYEKGENVEVRVLPECGVVARGE